VEVFLLQNMFGFDIILQIKYSEDTFNHKQSAILYTRQRPYCEIQIANSCQNMLW